MHAHISIKLEPFTSNKAHYKYSKNLTAEARTYREEFWKQLNTEPNLSNLKRIKGNFDPKKHELHVKYVFHLAYEKFFTKEGKISARSPDLDNCIKLVQDFLFNERYGKKHLKKLNYVNVGIDDRYITNIEMKKAPIQGLPFIEIQVEIHDLKFKNECL